MRNFVAITVSGLSILVAVAVPVLSILLASCQGEVKEFSEVLREDAVIEDVIYTPPKREPKITPSIGGSGMIGFGPGGIGIRMGKFQASEAMAPEKFTVVFGYRHGQFVIPLKEVYDRFNGHKDKMVDLTYREVYRETYKTKDGQKRAVARELLKRDFLDATLK